MAPANALPERRALMVMSLDRASSRGIACVPKPR